jgi:hypothetical protein
MINVEKNFYSYLKHSIYFYRTAPSTTGVLCPMQEDELEAGNA